ncbi:sensor histidine kinase [Salibacter halophilus]|uniref:histidine kinase n=1 Tax=Salibacter halophilus TaxID=1803916 RepID=A0A6N6M5P0_9FLAO|nr:PAS domain-containing protein [Salibacter halophilus]KAB1064843.1 PAS domain-containing protein [Salibacter halophilus]
MSNPLKTNLVDDLLSFLTSHSELIHDLYEKIEKDSNGNIDQSELLGKLIEQISDVDEGELSLLNPRIAYSILKTIPGIVFMYDLEKKKSFYINNQINNILGYSDSELNIDERFNELIHPDDVEVFARFFPRLLSLGEDEEMEYSYRVKHANGSYVWLSVREIVYSRDENGLPSKTVGIAQDVTDQVSKKYRLRESEILQNDLLNNTSQKFFYLDKNGRILTLNEKSKNEFVAANKVDPIGKVLGEFLPDLQSENFWHHFNRALASELTVYEDFLDYGPNERKYYRISMNPALDEEGSVRAVTVELTEMTQEVHYRERLKRSQERLQFALESSRDAVWEWNLDSNEVFYTGFLVDILGYDKQSEPFNRKDWLNHIHREDKRRVFSEFEKLLKGQQDRYSHEYRLKGDDDSHRWILDRGQVVEYRDSRPVRIIGTFTDITERIEQEQRLQKSEQRFQLAAKGMGVGIWDWNIKTERYYWSPQLFEILGYEPFELKSGFEGIEGFMHPDDKPKVIATLARYFKKQIDEFSVEYRVKHNNGDYIWVRSNGQAVFNNKGEPKRMVGSLENIHDGKVAQIELSKRQQLLNNINQNINEGIYRSTPDQKLLYCNDAFLRLFGVENLSEVEKQDFSTIVFYADGNDRETLRNELEQKGYLNNCEIKYQRRDGSTFWALLNCSVGTDEEGNMVYNGAIRDITEMKGIRKELIEAKERAEEMNKLKSSFLANMSHEVRTPINGILGLTEIIEETDDLSQLKEYSEMIRESGTRLLNTINSILHLSQMEASSGNFDLNEIELNNFVKSNVNLFTMPAQKKNIKLTFEPHNKDAKVLGDESMIDQILNNLIGNAIKFTDDGEVKVSISEKTRRKKLFYQIAVSDTGIGVSEDFLPRIFNEFEQESSGYARKFQGSGLGLAICKKYTELLGGTIKAESKKGEWTRFIVQLPAK